MLASAAPGKHRFSQNRDVSNYAFIYFIGNYETTNLIMSSAHVSEKAPVTATEESPTHRFNIAYLKSDYGSLKLLQLVSFKSLTFDAV